MQQPRYSAPQGACFVCSSPEEPEDHRAGALTRRQLLTQSAVTSVAFGAAALHSPSLTFANTSPLVEKPPNHDCIIEAPWGLVFQAGRLKLLPDCSVRIRKDRIQEVKSGTLQGNTPRIRATGQLLLPGFISGHTHACSATPTRGIIEGGRSYARPLELVEKLSPEDLDDLTAYNVAELLRSGCTTHVEMSLSLRQAESYVRIAKRWGVRGYPGGMIPGIARLFPIWFRNSDQVLTDSEQETLAEVEANRRFAVAHNGAEDGRIRPHMAPHATDTQTPKTMNAILAAAREIGNGIHIHLSQSAQETQTVQRLWGKRPAQWLDELGFYSERIFAAHFTGIDLQHDLPFLAGKNLTYAHCPSGNGAGGSGGTQPYPEALAAGVKTTIGIDTHSNDYIENLKLAVLYGRARARLLQASSPVALHMPSVLDAVTGATLGAAQGLGRDDLGRIAPGAKADLCTVDVSGFLSGSGVVPPEPLNNLLYAHGLSVQHVMTDGQFQVFHGQFVSDDAQQVQSRGGAVVQKIWTQLQDEKWFHS